MILSSPSSTGHKASLTIAFWAHPISVQPRQRYVYQSPLIMNTKKRKLLVTNKFSPSHQVPSLLRSPEETSQLRAKHRIFGRKYPQTTLHGSQVQ
ncbi:uncharacterized protein [Apostichopus japonicus]|uniref:uncharacterized protein n=1 Tax=Stichopus japonicus TaxID=307972 RepID=UPI003AB33F14